MSYSNVDPTSHGKQIHSRWRGVLAEYFEFPGHSLPQRMLLVVFALLLLLVVVCCTGHFSPFIAVALVVGLGSAVWAITRPQVALLLIFIAAGLPSFLVPLPGHTMRPVEAALVLAIVVIFVRRPTFHFGLSHLLMLLFISISIISFIHVPARSSGLNSYGADKGLFNLFLLLSAFFCGAFLVNYVKNISGFLTLALLCNLPFCLIGLAQWKGIHLPAILVPSAAIEVLQEGRLSGPSDSPTTFAFYLVNLFAVAIACWLLGTRRRDRVLGFVMALITLVNIIGSGTRSALIAVGLVILVALLINRRIRLLLTTLFLATAAGILFFDKVVSKFIHDPTSTSNRFFLWGQAFKLIVANPWIGIGLQQFPVYYAKLIVSQAARLDAAGISVHNQYVEWALESGVFWLIAGVALLVSIIFACWAVYRVAQPKYQLILLATICIVLANMVICLVDVPFDKAEGGVFLFLLGGLALGYVDFVRKGGGRAAPTRPRRTFALPQLPSVSSTGVGSGLYTRRYLPPPGRLRSYQTTLTLPALNLSGTLPADDLAPSAKKSSFAVIIQLISWGIAIPIIFPTTALLTHYLQPAQYGEYSYTLPFLAICALFTFTGMDPLLVRKLSRQKRSEWSSTLNYTLGARLFTTVMVSLVAACVALILPVSAEQRLLLLLGVGTLIFSYSFNCLRTVYESSFLAEQHVAPIGLLSTLNRLLTAGLIVVAVVLRLSLVQIYILIAYSDLPCFLVLAFMAHRRFKLHIRINPAQIRQIVRASFSLTGHDALALLSGQADILLLLPLAGSISVGIYALAMRITDPLMNVVYAYGNGIFPFLCSKFEEGRTEFALLYREAMRIMALAIIPLAVFVSVEAPAIIALLGGEHYAAAVPATRILMWSVTAAFFGNLTLQACMAANQEHRIPYATGLSLAANILANLVFIPYWQTTGAALAALSCEIVGLCLFSAILAHYVYVSKVVVALLKVLLGNIPGLLFLLWQQHMPVLYVLPLFVLLTLIGYIATSALSIKDVQMARQILVARREKRYA
jgi:O-antigen/teichoic acid export membrane protein/O-antigen ligase